MSISKERFDEAAEREARYFGEGSDARINGWALYANPHPVSAGEASPWYQWRRGWHDVDRHWGEWTWGRWKAKKLPIVVEDDLESPAPAEESQVKPGSGLERLVQAWNRAAEEIG